jgi:hypothetical protein
VIRFNPVLRKTDIAFRENNKEMTFSLHSLLKVESCNGVFGEASFIDVRESEKHKTFENFEKYEGKLIKFSLSDIWDYIDKL